MSNTPPKVAQSAEGRADSTTLRPFNLQDFLAGKPIVCRNGFVPTDAHYFERAKQILFTSQHECYIIRNGSVKGESHIDSKYDLFHPCEQKEGWVNLYKESDGTVYTHAKVHESEQSANSKSHNYNYLTTVKITWYE